MDWRLGRLIRKQLLAANTNSGLAKPNQQRIALQVVCNTTGLTLAQDYFYITDSASAAAWYQQDVTFPFPLLTVAEYGDSITRGIGIVTATGTTIFNVWEFTLPEDYLAAGLEQFRSEYSQWMR